jgi:hypothetical protein
MLLIFGSNFHLWGNSPIVRLKFVQNDNYMEIRPPDLIWWSENLLECQLPECSQDIEVRIANYDLIYGEVHLAHYFLTKQGENFEDYRCSKHR